MKKIFFASLIFCLFATVLSAQLKLEKGDPENPKNIPAFFKSKYSDVQQEMKNVSLGEVKIVATSPGGNPVYAVYYGEKENLNSNANYNSAIGARNPAYYAQKDKTTKPVVYFIGPVHGQEVENIVGLLNLIHVAETGKDYRGKDWPGLKNKMDKCRSIIIPCANPDGRIRCPYDSFVGIPTRTMTKYGQGTRKDGSLYGWPMTKSIHPMKGDVGILGAYFNDAGINIMHDEFFSPMAEETAAILKIAKDEAPDITVSLHSHENLPIILQPAHVGMFMKKRVNDLALRLNKRYRDAKLPFVEENRFWQPTYDDENGPRSSFNLIPALHHVSGTMSFTFECSHGSLSDRFPKSLVDHSAIVDIQLMLYDEMYDYILENKPNWVVEEQR